jgi:hypothetical protein
VDILGAPDEKNSKYDPHDMTKKVGDGFRYVLRRDRKTGSYKQNKEKSLVVVFDNAGKVKSAFGIRMPEYKGLSPKADMIRCIIEPHKDKWDIGETIKIRVTLYNRGRVPVSVIGPLNYNQVSFRLRSKKGELVYEEGSTGKQLPKAKLEDLRIHPGHFVGTTLELQMPDEERRAVSPGKYYLKGRYENGRKGEAPDAIQGVWFSNLERIVLRGE